MPGQASCLLGTSARPNGTHRRDAGLQLTFLAQVISLPIRLYRIVGSPFFGWNCRFQPSCSAYALEALEKHGAAKGTWLAAARLLRCHPWGGSGIDEVPD